MIGKAWYAVLRSEELAPGPVRVTVLGRDFVLIRDAMGEPHALNAYCPHRGCDLSMGWVQNNELTCAFHGWRFNGEGKCTHIPANRAGAPIPQAARLSSYPVCERFGLVWVYTSSPMNSSPQPAFSTFPELEQGGWTRVPFEAVWNAHFSRVVESVLDVSHLPFVHPETTGTDVNPIVDGPEYAVTGTGIVIHPTPFAPAHPMQPASAAPGMEDQTEIEIIFPNQWIIRTPTGTEMWMCTYLTFTPIDDKTTVIYGLAMRNFEPDSTFLDDFHVDHTEFVMNQDKEIVEHLRPMSAPPLAQEAHVASDGPTIRYRKMLFDALQGESR